MIFFFLMFLLFAGCVAFGIAALVGSAFLLIRYRMSMRIGPSWRTIAMLTLLIVAGAVALTIFFLSHETLLSGKVMLTVPLAGLAVNLVVLIYFVRNARRSNGPWKAAAFLISVGCASLAVPAALILWYDVSNFVEQTISKRKQAELGRSFPSETVYVPDVDTIPPGTEEGAYFSARPYDGRRQIQQTYHPPDDSSAIYDPDQVNEITLVQRPNANDLVRHCEEYAPGKELPGCEVVAVTPEGHKIRLKYPPEQIPEDPLTHDYYFVVMDEDNVEIDVYSESNSGGRPEDFNLVRFVDGLKSVPKEEYLEDPPQGTYWG